MNKDVTEMAQDENKVPKIYVLEQKLDSGAGLRILMFEPSEIKLQFKYGTYKPPTAREQNRFL